ncbi:MAG: hypothetical protein D6795_01400, partial [Deltaproteobacteria bacterium]
AMIVWRDLVFRGEMSLRVILTEAMIRPLVRTTSADRHGCTPLRSETSMGTSIVSFPMGPPNGVAWPPLLGSGTEVRLTQAWLFS